GIRDWSVTGVQTCALPIYHGPPDAAYAAAPRRGDDSRARGDAPPDVRTGAAPGGPAPQRTGSDPRRDRARSARRPVPGPRERDRSEERRVGKEGRSRWARG